MNKLNKTICLALFLALSLVLRAQTWKAMGLDESFNPSLGYTHSNTIAIAPDGTPYIAFTDDADKSTITVKKLDGQKWVKVGASFYDGYYTSSVSLTFGTDGSPYIAYNSSAANQNLSSCFIRRLVGDNWIKLDSSFGIFPSLAVGPDDVLYAEYAVPYGGGLTVKKFTNSWENAGDLSDVAGSPLSDSKITMAADGSLYVAYSPLKNRHKVSVKKLVAGKWQLVGTDGFSNAGATGVCLSVAADGTPYVAYQDSTAGNAAVIQQFKNGAWAAVSPAGLSKGAANYINMITAPGGRVYVAFCDGGDGDKAVVKLLSDGNWSTLDQGNLPPGKALYTSLAVTNAGLLYLTFSDYDMGLKAVVKKLSIGRWTNVGMGSVSSGTSKAVVVKVSKTGATYAAFNDAANYNKVSVKQYLSNAWQIVGPQTLSDAGIYTYSNNFLDMDLAPDGTPYIIYRDSTQQSCIIKKYDGTTWVKQGGSLGQYGGTDYKIVIAPNGTPYVTYYDSDYGSIALQKFSNGSWSYVGRGGISNGFALNPILVFDSNSVPYVSFSSGNTIGIKRFDGSAWVTIPADGLGTLGVREFNFTISPANVLYAAFYDPDTKQLITSTFDGNKWQPMGGSTGSGSNASAPKFLFDKTGQLYLAFLQYNSSALNTNVQLRKLSQGAWVDAGSSGMVPYNASNHSVAFNPAGDLVYGYLNGAMFVRTNTGDDLAAVPDIRTISPTLGSIGTVLTINGFNFSNASAVKIGGVAAASFTVVSPTLITAVLGSGATGPVSVATPNGVTEMGLFKYTTPPPVIRSFSPRYGDVNAIVSVKGKNFSTVANENIVYFGAVAGQVITANDSILTVKVPVGASAAPLTVTTRGLSAASGIFNVTFKSLNTFTAGTFAVKQDFTNVAQASSVTVKDMNGDAKPDVIVTGGGTAVLGNISTKNKFNFNTEFNRDRSGFYVTTGDMDGDGLDELVMATGVTVMTYKNTSTTGTTSFLSTGQMLQAVDYPFEAVTGDIDGDGRPDVVSITSHAATIAIFRNNGTSKYYTYFADEADVNLENFPLGANLADIDGDGKLDLLVSHSYYMNSDVYGYVAIYKNTSTVGKISFVKVTTPTMLYSGKGIQQPVIADLNNDGKPEIIVPNNNSNTISVFKNNSANGSVAFAPGVEFATGAKPAAITVADLDGDNLPDIATANYSNTVSVLKNTGANGTINFATTVDYKTTYQPGSIVAADIDGDQAPELIVSNYIGNNATIFRNGIVPFSLPADNFTVSAVSATCKGSNNGIINISASQSFTYTATLTGNSLNKTQSFTTAGAFSNLSPGTYSVCITLAEQSDYKQCFDMVITEPKDLSLYSTINAGNKTVDLALTGASVYHINLNGTDYTTTNAAINLPLNAGNNKLSITTDKECQGTIAKLINLSGIISPYPVPFQSTLNVNIGLTPVKNVSVQIYSVTDGKPVYTRQFTNQAGVLQLDAANFKSGIYTLHLILDGNENIFKVIKQ